jgi:hypothetical protein
MDRELHPVEEIFKKLEPSCFITSCLCNIETYLNEEILEFKSFALCVIFSNYNGEIRNQLFSDLLLVNPKYTDLKEKIKEMFEFKKDKIDGVSIKTSESNILDETDSTIELEYKIFRLRPHIAYLGDTKKK